MEDKKLFEKLKRYSGEHDGPLKAALTVLPVLKESAVREALSNCSENWPYGGVTNVEFSTALRYLGVFDLFEYKAEDGMTVSDFTGEGKGDAVLLCHGQYSIVYGGAAVQLKTNGEAEHAESDVVYAAWTLKGKRVSLINPHADEYTWFRRMIKGLEDENGSLHKSLENRERELERLREKLIDHGGDPMEVVIVPANWPAKGSVE